jgi:pimeloyl-ACP methyl ester carboxylesterase
MSKLRALVLAVAALFAFAATAFAGPSKVAWSKCYPEFGPSFECGTVQVPLDYADPNGATISIALARLPAGDPTHRIGSLFLNPGGPGGSGVDFVLGFGPFLYTSEVRARFDLVGFDPRGVSRSTAVRCFGTDKQWGPYFTPYAFPSSPAELQVWVAADRYVDAACAQRASRIIDHTSTANVARDMDQLRQAVGDEQLTYAGYSYGSYVGTTYANLFPGKVRALIIDGIVDPIGFSTGRGGEAATVTLGTRIRSAEGAQATLLEFFRLCDAGGPSKCPFAPHAADRFAALATKVKAQPIQIPMPDGSVTEVNYSNLILTTLVSLYNPLTFSDLAQVLAGLESLADPVALGIRLKGLMARPSLITKRGIPRYENFVESTPSVACSDSDNPHSYNTWFQDGLAADAQFGYFGSIWSWVWSLCAEWPGKDAGRYVGPLDTKTPTAYPVLVIGEEFDPATRFQGAVIVNDLLTNSVLLKIHGWGHSLYVSSLSTCASEAAGRYLVHRTLPASGTVCEMDPDFVPFAK